MKRWTTRLALSLLLICSTESSSFALSADPIEQGLAHLKAGRYQHAEHYLRQGAAEHPTDSSVHYFLANALVYLGKHDDAIREYQASYRIDPFSTVSGYCRRALLAYHADIPEGDTANGGAEHMSSARAIVHNYAPRVDDRVNNAIDKIRGEAETEKGRHHQFADSLSTSVVKSAEQQAAQIQEAAKDEIDKIYNPPPTLVGRSRYNPLDFSPEYQKAKASEVRRAADEAAQLARSRAAQKAEVYKRWTQEHDYALDETASNLEKQLHDRNLPGTPRLAATGTGLYVRNYAPSEHPSPYPEPHPGVARITRTVVGPQDAESSVSSEAQAKQQQFEPADNPANTVRGTVLNDNGKSKN